MKKNVVGIVLLLLFAFGSHAQPEQIVVGCGNFRPMFFQGDRGQVTGRDADLWRLWSQKTGIAVEFRIMEWADVIPALLNGEIDVVNGASYTPERAKLMGFTKSYQDFLAYLFFHKQVQPLRNVADLQGQTIGVLKGSNIEEFLRLNVPKVRVVPFATYESLATSALDGQLKVFIAEEPLISYYLTRAGGTNDFRRSANVVLDSSLCMAVRLDDTALLDTISQGLAAITKAGRRQIDENWFGIDLDSPRSQQWDLWLFLLLGIGVATTVMMALARTWEKEILNIQNVRAKFINMWIVFAAVLAPPLFLVTMIRASEFGWLPLHYLQLLIVIIVVSFAIFRNHIHYYARTLLVLAGLYFLGLGGLLTYGIVGPTQLPLMTLVIVTVILFGMKGVLISIIVSIATIGSVFLAMQLGIVTPSYDIAAYSASLAAWSTVFALFAFYAIGLGLGIAGVYKHMEDALYAQRESESLFRNLVETTSDLIWETNAAGEFVYSSPQVKAILGYTPDEALGKKFYAFMVPGERQRLAAAFRKFTETGKAFTALENTNLHKEGQRVILESSGVPVLDEQGAAVGYRGVARDVTERKKAEEERERLMFAVEQAAESIVITDAEANIQYVNPTFERTTGYERSEAIGQNLRLMKSDEYEDGFYEEMWDTLSQGETWSGKINNKKKDGTPFTEEVVISPVRDSLDKIINYIAVQHDITNEIKLEEQWRQAQKMEAVGQLAGGVAHDFNNLLQAIIGHGDLAMDEVGMDNAAYKSLTEIMQASKRAGTLVRQLLAFSRRQVLEMKDINLNEVVTNLVKMIQRVIGEHIALEVHDTPDIGTVCADVGQIEQILMNLCVNARDAMPEGGTITITTENVELDEPFCEATDWDKPGRYVCLRVADTGCGMDEETRSKIFEPFFTTKEVGKGTGLGLSTVYGIAKQHGGFVHVSSEVGKGTTFSIYLPLVDRSATAATVKTKGAVPGGTETILIAEDDDLVCRLAETVLKRYGYTVLTAADGAEAMDLFNKHANEISLILLDVIMPKLSGTAVFERVRETRPDICVLFSSGYSIDTVHAGVVFNKRTQMIQKPYHPDDLLRKVRQGLLDGKSA